MRLFVNGSWRAGRRVAGAVVLGLVAGGCGSDDGRVAVEADLRGRLYVAVSADDRVLVGGRGVKIFVGDSVIDACGGCRCGDSLTYELQGEKLKVMPFHTVAHQDVGCGAEVEEQEAWLRALLRDSPTVRVRDGGSTLILSTADDASTFASRPRAQGRRVVSREALERFYAQEEQLTADFETDSADVDSRVRAGKLSRREGRAENARNSENFSRRHAAAAERMQSSAR